MDATEVSAAAADACKRETLPNRSCSTCHVVADDQQVGTTQTPAFSTIARKSDFTEATLALFLLKPASPNAGYEFVAKRSGRFSGLYQNAKVTRPNAVKISFYPPDETPNFQRKMLP